MVVQGEDDDFETCYTKAQSWLQTIHERLQTCDKVQGSKEILEARLKETKEILAKEPEGSMWIHKVQVKADLLLDHISEAKKQEIHRALREIKTTWEDTQINMVHCHSRIEWVLLHWLEYLKAREDYFSWLVNVKRMLESDLELQLTLKEKKYQLSHHQTLLNSIFNQAALLERLLQESGSLFATTADETLNEKGQQELKVSHEELEQKAKQKVTVLEEIVRDHQLYLDSLEKFQNWLRLMTEKYNSCNSHKNCKDHVDGSLKELTELSDTIRSKEGELDNLKSQAEAVIKNTSPKGAEDIKRDLEQLRTDWEDLQQKCEQHQAPLQQALQNVLEHQSGTQQLERELAEILDQLQVLELEPPDESEPEIVWRNCLITRSSILAVESRVEELQMKLKNLGIFLQNDTLSAKVLNVIQECNRVKGKIMRRSSQLVENLRQGFQELLKEFKQWKNNTRNLLDSALDTNGEAFPNLYLQRIEDQLTCSNELQVKLDRFRVLEGMLTKVFNSEQAAAFGAELREASWQREFFNDLLIKRRGQIQANNRDLANYKLLVKKFEDWLKGEDQKLTSILAANNARNSRERKRRRQVLKMLNCHVPHGQKIFEELIGVECARVNEEEKQLEDLRYRWILYKTKLSEAGDLLSQGQDEVEEFGKPSGGICRYLSRACCAALPLQLLLLFLLLLAFLLPLIEEQDSCSVVNNFARSFYLTLRYQGPPPT